MTRKRFEKLMFAALTKCHEQNRAHYGKNISYKPGKSINPRDYKLPAGMSYEQVWRGIERVMLDSCDTKVGSRR